MKARVGNCCSAWVDVNGKHDIFEESSIIIRTETKIVKISSVRVEGESLEWQGDGGRLKSES